MDVESIAVLSSEFRPYNYPFARFVDTDLHIESTKSCRAMAWIRIQERVQLLALLNGASKIPLCS